LLGHAIRRTLLHQGPVGLAAPAGRDQRLRIILAVADLEHVLGDAGVGRPFREFGAPRHVDHAMSPPARFVDWPAPSFTRDQEDQSIDTVRTWDSYLGT